MIIGGVNLGSLPDYLFFFSNGSDDADWKDSKTGYLGDAAVNGLSANEHTNSDLPYAGTIFTNAASLGDWQGIVDSNPGQAFASTDQTALIEKLSLDLTGALWEINALTVTPGFEGVSADSLDGLDTQNGTDEVFVINITSGFDVSAPINITGDAGDVFILRWDEDADPTNGYQGVVRFRQGGAIVPHGGLTPANFMNVAGQIDSAGGGSAPAAPYPQGPRYDDGQGSLIAGGSDWTSGGFFTGYWLTTGEPSILDPATGLYYGTTGSLSNSVFVGGWYTMTTRFQLTAQSGGVHISPNPAVTKNPDISIVKLVSVDGGATFEEAECAPGPLLPNGVKAQFLYVVTNTGDVPLSNIVVTDDVLGDIATLETLAVGESRSFMAVSP